MKHEHAVTCLRFGSERPLNSEGCKILVTTEASIRQTILAYQCHYLHCNYRRIAYHCRHLLVVGRVLIMMSCRLESEADRYAHGLPCA